MALASDFLTLSHYIFQNEANMKREIIRTALGFALSFFTAQLPAAPAPDTAGLQLFFLPRSRHGRRYRFLLATDFLCALLRFSLLSIFWIRITHNRYYPVIG